MNSEDQNHLSVFYIGMFCIKKQIMESRPVSAMGRAIQRLKMKQMAAIQFKIIEHCHYKCSICDKNFVSEQSLNGHFRAVHEDMKLNKCNVCEKHFSTKYQLNGHIATIHEGIQG